MGAEECTREGYLDSTRREYQSLVVFKLSFSRCSSHGRGFGLAVVIAEAEETSRTFTESGTGCNVDGNSRRGEWEEWTKVVTCPFMGETVHATGIDPSIVGLRIGRMVWFSGRHTPVD